MKIAVLGPGGVGAFLACALARAGEDVVVVAREQTAAILDSRGIELHSAVLGEVNVRLPAVTALRHPADVLLIATKAVGLPAALERIQAPVRLVVPLLNGIDHMALVRQRLGAALVAAGTIRIDADRSHPAVIVQSSPSVAVHLASEQRPLVSRLAALAGVLQTAGIDTRVSCGEAQILWSKLVRLNALALCTSAADLTLGEIRADSQWLGALQDVVGETAAVAAADGAHVDPADTMAELQAAHGSLASSMQRDIVAGRPAELDAIAGAVLRAARRHGIPCPTVARLAATVAARAGMATSAAS